MFFVFVIREAYKPFWGLGPGVVGKGGFELSKNQQIF
jgi:hypothetical protein